jgi:hypothetical protein
MDNWKVMKCDSMSRVVLIALVVAAAVEGKKFSGAALAAQATGRNAEADIQGDVTGKPLNSDGGLGALHFCGMTVNGAFRQAISGEIR